MVTTRTGTHADAEPRSANSGEAELGPVTPTAQGLLSEDPRRPIMDAAPNATEMARSDVSSMAPMMAMFAEMQRELGDLRRKSRNGLSDNEDSDDGLVSDPIADSSRSFAEDELQSRTHNAMLPEICHDPRFRRILDYRYYRLHKRSSRYDAEVAGRVAKWTRQLEASLKLRFDGSDPLAVLQFLHSFVEADNTNGINEGAAVYVLRSFLDSPARE
jgi:hypothetical protein